MYLSTSIYGNCLNQIKKKNEYNNFYVDDNYIYTFNFISKYFLYFYA